MGAHSAPSRTRLTARTVIGSLSAVGLAAVLTGSAAADPVTPITCAFAPGWGCPDDGLIDATVEVDRVLCARGVVAHDDGRVAVVGASVPCPTGPGRTRPAPPVTPPRAPVAPAPTPIDGSSGDYDLPRVNH